MYFLLHTLIKKKRPFQTYLSLFSLSFFFFFCFIFHRGQLNHPKWAVITTMKIEKKWTYRTEKESSLFLRLLRRVVVLQSQTIQKTNYGSKHKWFSASWFRSTSVCLFTKLMCCFSFHDLETKPAKQFCPLKLLMLLSAISYNEHSNWINSVILW